MIRYLLDANVLIALTAAEHEHHEAAVEWLAETTQFATCPTTEGALLRFLLRLGEPATMALERLRLIRALPAAEFWPSDLSYADIDAAGLIGHHQATDLYLACLAAAHGGLLATFDKALHASRPDLTFLIPRP